MTKITANTSIGQHFLKNENLLSLLVDQIPYDSKVLEIGAGPGQLTERLAQRVTWVCAVEVDEKFLLILEKLEKKYQNLNVIYENVLKLDFDEYKNYWIVGNIPYHIVEPLMSKLIRTAIVGVIFLVGDSFAKEVFAIDNDFKKFGKLSLMVKTFFESKILAKVSKDNFFPKPRTESAMLMFKPLDQEIYRNNKKMFLLRQLFLTSEKGPLLKNVLMNSLVNFNHCTKNEARAMVAEYKFSEIMLNKSFEQLNNKEYLILYKALASESL
jgi:16S rRNA (adenine1518-N6/adenine1519-N6)-dimethyltransferase